jgi:uncharacterized membrane protein YjgN (DUF898 family)
MEEIDAPYESAFGFDGTWQEFAPIAFTNLLLTIVTLGVYRFWATARERRYLWSRTRFIDERLEWAGTGLELFFGAILVLLVFLLPYFLAIQVAQALVLRGQEGLGALVTLTAFVALFYLYGLARYRALRYRLSRTRWRGIRGGSDDPGFSYGLTYMWKTVAGILPAGLLIPWSMTELWNDRWERLSFGPFPFRAHADSSGLFARFLLFYAAPFIMIIAFFLLGGALAMAGFIGGGESGPPNPAATVLVGAVALIVFYLGWGLIAMAFYAKFYREAVGATHWDNLDFEFGASTKDWLLLILGDVAVVVLTLGIGLIFISYRHWKFFITHMEARGEILLDDLTQSTTKTAGHGEGLLDAFDVGAV